MAGKHLGYMRQHMSLWGLPYNLALFPDKVASEVVPRS